MNFVFIKGCTAPADDPNDYYQLKSYNLSGDRKDSIKTNFHETACGSSPSLININEEKIWFEINSGTWTEISISENGNLIQTGRSVEAPYQYYHYAEYEEQYSYQDTLISTILTDQFNLSVATENVQTSKSFNLHVEFQEILGFNFSGAVISSYDISWYDLTDVNVYISDFDNISINEYFIFFHYYNQTNTEVTGQFQSLNQISTRIIRYNNESGVTKVTTLMDIGDLEGFSINEKLGLFSIFTRTPDAYHFTILNSTLDVVNNIELITSEYVGQDSFSNDLLYFYLENSYISLNPLDERISESYPNEYIGRIVNGFGVRTDVYTKNDSPLSFPNIIFGSLIIVTFLRSRFRKHI